MTTIHLKFLRFETLHVPVPKLGCRGREGDDGPGGGAATTPVVPHERFVVPDKIVGVGKLPAVATEVLEAGKVPIKVELEVDQELNQMSNFTSFI